MSRGARVVGLDLLFMSVNFSALTLFSTLSAYVSKYLGVHGTLMWLAAAVYSAGIFASFFVGHSRFTEEHPRLTVLIAALLAAVPQIVLPYSPAPGVVVVLRFIQGLVMMALPIFSAQIGMLYSHARPLALGIILSGIFIGGLIGSTLGPLAAQSIGWRGAFVAFGIAMIVSALIWIGATPRETLPKPHEGEAAIDRMVVWRKRFTIVWGFTFFPALWIIFTLAPLITFIIGSLAKHIHYSGLGQLASTALEASYVAWSIAIGGIAYACSRGGTTPRQLFNAFARVQTACFIVSAIGLALALEARNLPLLLLSIVLIAVVQGTGPTFWSTPSTAYPRELATIAGYALGLISNSAALIGPLTSVALRSVSIYALWGTMIGMAVWGALQTWIASRMRLPIEELRSIS